MSNILFKDRIVTTYSGKKAKRSLCKKIKNEFYLIGDPSVIDSGECYLVESKYHRFNNGKIEYDYEKKNYILIHKNHLKNGIVDIDKKGNPILGYFSPNLTKNIIIGDVENTSSRVHCISEEIAKELKYREHLGSGIFYQRDSKNVNFFNKISRPPVSKNELPYDSRFASNITTTQYDTFYNPDFNNVNLNTLGDFLDKNGITFGVEFETCLGYIPDRICYKYGIIPLRDGSISGLEYVTIPYSGRKGLYALRGVCRELAKRTKFDLSCALHLHLGGVSRNMTNILSSYILGYLMQDNMFNLQPAYKKGGLGIKDKDYCSPLEKKLFKSIHTKVNSSNIKNEFSKLFKFVSDGNDFSSYDSDLKKVKSHPSDPEGTRKWQIRSRYRWLNFVPIIFGNKKTLEFRHHNGTFDFDKVIHFLFTCATFIKVSNDYKEDVLNNTSDLYKSLVTKPLSALETISSFLLKKGHTELKDIINENNIYNEVRAGVMKELLDKDDLTGQNESRYEKSYTDKLNSTFWKDK